ncbi:MAG: hypothetical protein AAGH64_03035 [Planctomycetota bacterium]
MTHARPVSTRSRLFAPALLALCPLLAGAPAGAQTATRGERDAPAGMTAMAIDDALGTSLVRVLSIDAGVVEGEDGAGARVRYEPGELVALVRVAPATDVTLGVGVADAVRDGAVTMERVRVRARGLTAGVLTTTDGARYPGALSDEEYESGDGFAWTDATGTRLFALEDVASVVMDSAPASVRLALPAGVASDTLLLANGDVLQGFLAGINTSVELERDDGGTTELPPDRVRAIVLANPEEPPAPMRAWFDDGAVIGSDSIVTQGGGWLADDPASPPDAWRSLAGVRAIALDADRLVPLGDLGIARSAGGPVAIAAHDDDRLLELVPALGARDVVLPGDADVAFELPPNAERFACTLRLVRPDSSWADCEVVVLFDGGEVSRTPLAGGRGPVAVNVAVPDGARTLGIRIDPARFGAVHDAVRLARPLVLLAE